MTGNEHIERFVGLVGLGYWGKNLLRVLSELGALHTACDSDPATLMQREAERPGLHYTESLDEVLGSAEIKAVAIATPAATHYRLAKEALLSGKDVFVEKPLALSVSEGAELAELAENRNRILMVGHILRYHPALLKLKEVISAGELGRIQYVYSNRLNIGRLRTEENILWSFAPHDISVLLMLMGEEPIGVEAFGGDYLSRGIYDTTLTTLEFNNGVKGHIFVSWLHPYKEQKLIVVGSKAMAVFDDLSDEKLRMYRHRIEWQDGKVPVAHKADYEVVPVEPAEPLRLEMEHFLECVRERGRPRTDAAEALRVLRILASCERGLRQPSKPEERTEEEYFVHESSFIDENVQIGRGTKIWYFCHVLRGTRIGRNCILGQNVMVGPNVRIGDRVKLQNNVSVYEGVELEDEVFCGPSMVFTNVINPRAFIERKDEYRKTLVKRGATLGANATVLCGLTIGEYAFVGAGAVVTKDVLPYELVAGVPARRIGYVCRCAVRLRDFDAECTSCCPRCGTTYKLSKEGLRPIDRE